MTSQQILALSDSASFFSAVWERPLFGELLVRLSGRSNPRIAYVGAAHGDAAHKTLAFVRLADRLGASADIASLFDPPSPDPDQFFSQADAIFIDGGSTRNLMALLREWGADDALRDAHDRGVLITGASAGANILFDWSVTDSVKSHIDIVQGLGLLQGTLCVHHNADPERARVFNEFLSGSSSVFPAYRINDGAALYFQQRQCAAVHVIESGELTVRSPDDPHVALLRQGKDIAQGMGAAEANGRGAHGAR